MTEKCSQCNTDIITCHRCRKKHCYHHYCPEQDGYNIPPKEVWNEEKNKEHIRKLDEVFRK